MRTIFLPLLIVINACYAMHDEEIHIEQPNIIQDAVGQVIKHKEEIIAYKQEKLMQYARKNMLINTALIFNGIIGFFGYGYAVTSLPHYAMSAGVTSLTIGTLCLTAGLCRCGKQCYKIHTLNQMRDDLKCYKKRMQR